MDSDATDETRHSSSAHTYLPTDSSSSTHAIPQKNYDPTAWLRVYGISPILPGLSPSFGRSSLLHGISPAHPLSIPPSWSLPPRRSQGFLLLPPSLSGPPSDDLKLDTRRTPDSQTPKGNRFRKASQFLSSTFRQLTHRRVEVQETNEPITIQLDGNPTQLEELAFVTSKDVDHRGICTVDLAYADENGLACLTFRVMAAACETGAKFINVNLHVRLLDPDTRDVVEPERFEPNSLRAEATPPELTTGTSRDLRVAANASSNPAATVAVSHGRNATLKTTEINSVSGMMYKKGIQWTMVENTEMGRGVRVNGGIFTLWIRRALPLSAEIRIFAEYQKHGRVKRFERPGKDNYLEYRLITKVVN